MASFDDREKGYESKFAHEEKLQFEINARRDKLLGLWAAEKIGLAGEEAEAYAKKVVIEDMSEPGDEDVYRLVKADLDTANAGISEHQLRRQMEELRAVAREQVVNAE